MDHYIQTPELPGLERDLSSRSEAVRFALELVDNFKRTYQEDVEAEIETHVWGIRVLLDHIGDGERWVVEVQPDNGVYGSVWTHHDGHSHGLMAHPAIAFGELLGSSAGHGCRRVGGVQPSA